MGVGDTGVPLGLVGRLRVVVHWISPCVGLYCSTDLFAGGLKAALAQDAAAKFVDLAVDLREIKTREDVFGYLSQDLICQPLAVSIPWRTVLEVGVNVN
jgi:hypothetical protein